MSRQSFDRLIAAKPRSYADLLSAGELHKLSRAERVSGPGLREAQRISSDRTSEALRSFNFADEVRAAFMPIWLGAPIVSSLAFLLLVTLIGSLVVYKK